MDAITSKFSGMQWCPTSPWLACIKCSAINMFVTVYLFFFSFMGCGTWQARKNKVWRCVCVCVCVVCVCVSEKDERQSWRYEGKSAHFPRRDSNLYLWDTRPPCFRLHYEGKAVCVFVCACTIWLNMVDCYDLFLQFHLITLKRTLMLHVQWRVLFSRLSKGCTACWSGLCHVCRQGALIWFVVVVFAFQIQKEILQWMARVAILSLLQTAAVPVDQRVTQYLRPWVESLFFPIKIEKKACLITVDQVVFQFHQRFHEYRRKLPDSSKRYGISSQTTANRVSRMP